MYNISTRQNWHLKKHPFDGYHSSYDLTCVCEGGEAGGGLRGAAPPQRGAPVVRMVGVAQHCIHTVHLAQLLEERDEVQELCVRHVVEPGGHRHLDKQMHQSVQCYHTVNTAYCTFSGQQHFWALQHFL